MSAMVAVNDHLKVVTAGLNEVQTKLRDTSSSARQQMSVLSTSVLEGKAYALSLAQFGLKLAQSSRAASFASRLDPEQESKHSLELAQVIVFINQLAAAQFPTFCKDWMQRFTRAFTGSKTCTSFDLSVSSEIKEQEEITTQMFENADTYIRLPIGLDKPVTKPDLITSGPPVDEIAMWLGGGYPDRLLPGPTLSERITDLSNQAGQLLRNYNPLKWGVATPSSLPETGTFVAPGQQVKVADLEGTEEGTEADQHSESDPESSPRHTAAEDDSPHNEGEPTFPLSCEVSEEQNTIGGTISPSGDDTTGDQFDQVGTRFDQIMHETYQDSTPTSSKPPVEESRPAKSKRQKHIFNDLSETPSYKEPLPSRASSQPVADASRVARSSTLKAPPHERQTLGVQTTGDSPQGQSPSSSISAVQREDERDRSASSRSGMKGRKAGGSDARGPGNGQPMPSKRRPQKGPIKGFVDVSDSKSAVPVTPSYNSPQTQSNFDKVPSPTAIPPWAGFTKSCLKASSNFSTDDGSGNLRGQSVTGSGVDVVTSAQSTTAVTGIPKLRETGQASLALVWPTPATAAAASHDAHTSETGASNYAQDEVHPNGQTEAQIDAGDPTSQSGADSESGDDFEYGDEDYPRLEAAVAQRRYSTGTYGEVIEQPGAATATDVRESDLRRAVWTAPMTINAASTWEV